MKRTPEALTDGSWDLLSFGRGIIGAGAALNATLRGLCIALIDKVDSAAGTSSLSSKLIHRDLSYLEHGDFHLVYGALHQRGRLLHARRPPTPLHQTPNAAGPDQTHPDPSPVALGPNALDRVVDRSGVEAHAAQNRMENVDLTVAVLPCLPLSHAPPGVSIPRSIRPQRQTLPHERTSVCPSQRAKNIFLSAVIDVTPLFSLRENTIAKEPGSSYPERWLCVS